MKNLFLLNKRGLSNIIAYVLLISITVALSVLVFNWLRFYVGNGEDRVDVCPEGVSISIRDYSCLENGYLNLTLKNGGRFNIDGYSLRAHNRPGAELGLYTLDENGTSLVPGEEYTKSYPLGVIYDGKNLTTLTLIEVQPFRVDKKKLICKSYSSQKIVCQ